MSSNKQSPITATVVTKAGESLIEEKISTPTTSTKDNHKITTLDDLIEKKANSHKNDNTQADEIIAKDKAAKQRIIEENLAEEKKAQELAEQLKVDSDKDATDDDTSKNHTQQKLTEDNNTKDNSKSNTTNNATNSAQDSKTVADTDSKVVDSEDKDETKSETKSEVKTDMDISTKAKEETAQTTRPISIDTDTDTDTSNAQTTQETTSTDKNSTDTPNTDTTSDDAIITPINKNSEQKTDTDNQDNQDSQTTGRRRVAILGGNRIPFARSNGNYANASNIDMLTAALNGLVERYNLQGKQVGEVVAGAVIKLSRDLNLTRESVLNTALSPQTPAYDISQACGTGLQATFATSNKIALGIIDSAIAGGVDTTSDAPIAIGDGLRKVLLQLGAAKNNKQRLKALLNLNPKDLIDTPQNGEPRTGLSMGDHQAITALEWNISREAQDELTLQSHHNLARAYDDGFFDDLITPYKGLTRDNNLRPDTNLEKLASLKPVFGKKNANPTMTAANSTPLTDGASCVLLGSEQWAEEHGLKPLAYLVHQETAAVDFIGKQGEKEGLLMAPAYAVPRMLKRAGLSLQDFDFYEIHEAFASQVLSTLAAWEDETFCQERLGLDAPLGAIDRNKLNVNGSSLAAGHPFAATGGRILATAAKLLDQKGSGRALISICAAGGQGVTCILEK